MVPKKKLHKDVIKAIEWAAAEFKYVEELKEELKQVEKEGDPNKEKEELRKAIKIFRYVGLSERRASQFENNVEKDLKKNYHLLSVHLGKKHNFVKHHYLLFQKIRRVIKELNIEHNSLIEYASRYEGLLKEELTEAEAEAQLLADIESKHNQKKAEAVHGALQNMVRKLLKQVGDIENWLSGLETTLKKAQQISDTLTERDRSPFRDPTEMESYTSSIMSRKGRQVSRFKTNLGSEGLHITLCIGPVVRYKEFNRPFDVQIQDLRDKFYTIDKEISAEIKEALEKEDLWELSKSGIITYCRNKGIEPTEEIYDRADRASSMGKQIMRSEKIQRKIKKRNRIKEEISEINKRRYDFSTVPAELRPELIVGKQGTLIYREEKTTSRLADFVDGLSSFRDMGDFPEKLRKTKKVGYIAHVEVPFASRGKGFAQALSK